MDDVPVYLGLVADMFPQQPLPKQRQDPIKEALEQVLTEQNLQPLPSLVEKGMQLYETQLVRHGLLVVWLAHYQGKMRCTAKLIWHQV